MQALLDLLFPPRCAGCRRRGARFCDHCQGDVWRWRQTTARCRRCDRPTASPLCALCRRTPSPLLGVRVAGVYDAALKTAILAFKFKRQRQLGEPLGAVMAGVWLAEAPGPADGVAWIPMPADRLRQRGYNPAELLAVACARRLRLPLLPDALGRTRAAPPQHGLDADARRSNAAGLFAVPPGSAPQVQRRAILLIDDVTTTGATLDAAATALLAGGAAAVWGLALARPGHTGAGV